MTHQAKDGTTVPSRDGWFYARCSCGRFKFGPVPDVEIVVDVLMEHAFEMGARSRRPPEEASKMSEEDFADRLRAIAIRARLRHATGSADVADLRWLLDRYEHLRAELDGCPEETPK